MIDFVSYIKNIFNFITGPAPENRKRRANFDDLEVINPKIRRLSVSQMSNSAEDDWLSTSSTGSLRRSNLLQPMGGARPRTSWSKENVTINLDDDDDIEVKPKESWQNVVKKSKSAPFTSTPQFSNGQHLHNGDSDVTFVKYVQSSADKKADNKKRGFDYIKPSSFYLKESQNGARVTQNSVRDKLSSCRDSKIPSLINRRTPSRRPTILDETFRLDEKLKYKELLAQAAPTYSSLLSRPLLNDSFSKYSTPTGKIFSYGSSSRGKKLIELAQTKGQKPVAFVDLTENTSSKSSESRRSLTTKETILKVLEDHDNDAVIIKDSDSDIEILPMPPSPKPDVKVDRINSLKIVNDTSESVHSEWLNKLILKHKEDSARRQREIKERTEQSAQLNKINYEIKSRKLVDHVQKCLHIKDTVLPVREPEEETVLPILTDKQEEKIDYALNKRANPNEVLAQKFNLNIARRDLLTLAGLNWLNDEVINFYMNLIIERGKGPQWPNVHAMNTFFYPKLLKDGPASLMRWTRKIDIFSLDMVVVPIHLGVHWCMSIIDFRSMTIRYYDSMGGTNRKCLEALLHYLEYEHLNKKKCEYDTGDWMLEHMTDIPQQMNGSDCGMFSCTFAEYLTRNAKISFSQEDMPYLRRKMVLEIIEGRLLIS